MALLFDGYQTFLSIQTRGPAISMVVKETQAPELDGRGPIDTTVMRNLGLTSQLPKSLVHTGDATLQCQYDPVTYTDLITVINRVRIIVVDFPDLSALGFWGWFGKFTPASNKEGEFPLAEVKIHVSNWNPLTNAQEGYRFFPPVAPGRVTGNGLASAGRDFTAITAAFGTLINPFA